MQKRETWWWNTTVQEAIARKKRMFKKWQQSKAQEDHASYKEVKRTVAVERARAAQERYDKLDTREGEMRSLGWQNLETRQPKITTKVTL